MKTARELMHRPVISVCPAMELWELERLFERDDISGAPVVDADQNLVGVVTRTDLAGLCRDRPTPPLPPPENLPLQGQAIRRLCREDEAALPQTVKSVMSVPPRTVSVAATAREVAQQMHQFGIHRLIVVDGAAVVGIVTASDLIEYIAAGAL